MTRIELQPAYILHTRPYRDTSLLVDVLTEDHGKITLVAKGARSKKNKQRSLFQPFQSLSISWQGKSSLKTLIDIEAISTGFFLQGNCLYSAMYVNELLTYLLPQDDPSDQIFIDYQQLLYSLAQPEVQLEPCLRRFEFSLLTMLGYGVDCSVDSDGHDIIDHQSYRWLDNHGFIVSQEGQVYLDSPPVFSGAALQAIASNDYSSDQTRKTAKLLIRQLLAPLLKGKTIKSRELFV